MARAVVVMMLACALIASPEVGGAGVLDIEWHAPTTNADGSPLVDLAEYRVYADTGALPCPSAGFQTLAAPDPAPLPGATFGATLTGLTAGATYWIRVSAVDSDGNESECTPAVSGPARVEIDVAPTALSFGSATVGTTLVQDLRIQNVGPVRVTGTATTGAPFSIVSGGALDLAPGASQVVRVGFTPTAEQVFASRVVVTTTGDEVSPSVSGTGVMAAPAVLQFSQASYTVTEGGVATITVTRTGGTHGGVTVSYATGDETATAGVDYRAASGTLTFGSGVMSQTFTVSTARDKVLETTETISLRLGSPQGGAVLGTVAASTLTVSDKERTRIGRKPR